MTLVSFVQDIVVKTIMPPEMREKYYAHRFLERFSKIQSDVDTALLEISKCALLYNGVPISQSQHLMLQEWKHMSAMAVTQMQAEMKNDTQKSHDFIAAAFSITHSYLSHAESVLRRAQCTSRWPKWVDDIGDSAAKMDSDWVDYQVCRIGDHLDWISRSAGLPHTNALKSLTFH